MEKKMERERECAAKAKMQKLKKDDEKYEMSLEKSE